jgi:hypothetical protein
MVALAPVPLSSAGFRHIPSPLLSLPLAPPPPRFVAELFIASGLKREDVVVVPEAVDTVTFDPNRVQVLGKDSPWVTYVCSPPSFPPPPTPALPVAPATQLPWALGRWLQDTHHTLCCERTWSALGGAARCKTCAHCTIHAHTPLCLGLRVRACVVVYAGGAGP